MYCWSWFSFPSSSLFPPLSKPRTIQFYINMTTMNPVTLILLSHGPCFYFASSAPSFPCPTTQWIDSFYTDWLDWFLVQFWKSDLRFFFRNRRKRSFNNFSKPKEKGENNWSWCYFQYLKGFYLGLEKELQSHRKNTSAEKTSKSIFSRCYQNADFFGGKTRHEWHTVVAAIPRAAHAISVAPFLLPPAQHARRRCLMRTVTVPPNFTFLVIGARIDLEGKWKSLQWCSV